MRSKTRLLCGANLIFLACLEETSENSPGFQAWEHVDVRTSSPEGTAEIVRLHRVCTKIEMLPFVRCVALHRAPKVIQSPLEPSAIPARILGEQLFATACVQ